MSRVRGLSAVLLALTVAGCTSGSREIEVGSDLDPTRANQLYVTLDRFGLSPSMRTDPKTHQIGVVVSADNERAARHVMESYRLVDQDTLGDLLAGLEELEKSLWGSDRSQRLEEMERQVWEHRKSRDLESLPAVVRAVVSLSVPPKPSLAEEFQHHSPEPPVVTGWVAYSVELVNPEAGAADELRRTIEEILVPPGSNSAGRVQVELVPVRVLPSSVRIDTKGATSSIPGPVGHWPVALIAISGLAALVLLARLRRDRSLAAGKSRPVGMEGA